MDASHVNLSSLGILNGLLISFYEKGVRYFTGVQMTPGTQDKCELSWTHFYAPMDHSLINKYGIILVCKQISKY